MADVDLNKLSQVALKIALTSGAAEWGRYGNAYKHKRYAEQIDPKARRRCVCGCKTRRTHVGMANGVALISGCHLSIMRWVRDGFGKRRAGGA